MTARAHCVALGMALAALLLFAPAASADDGAATSLILHMLDYVAVDYPEFVRDGKVLDEAEYAEQLEFASQVFQQLRQLPERPQKQALIAEAEGLIAAICGKRSGDEVSAAARQLYSNVIRAYDAAITPKRAPDTPQGAALYQTLCASCHGAEGRGDGAAGVDLDPAPSDFNDTARMAQRSAYGLYNTITLGVGGTGMASYQQLSDDQRWSLAFYVAGLSRADERAQGEALWRDSDASSVAETRRAFPDIGNVATLSANEVRARFGANAAALQAYLLAQPQALAANKPAPIAFSIDSLTEAVAAYRRGDRAHAQTLAITAYLEGFELVEASLINIDAGLVAQIEREMMTLRGLMQSGAPVAAVERQFATTQTLLSKSQDALSGSELSPGATFVSAFLILLREGLEAILVLAAIIAFLNKAKRRDALPYVHAGWAIALALGAATWLTAVYVIDISGANREITEGVTALLASIMLIYVGFWLHSKAYAHAWTQFIREQVGAALGKRTLWALALVSFLAVYRELFEIVLFYQALWAQAGDRTALLAGVGVGVVALFAIGWAIFKYSVRLPLGPFFAVMSLSLALLAVVFAGNGIAALQEAGVIAVNAIDFVTVPVLGVFPTAQTLGAQAAALAVIVLSFYLASRRHTGASTARA